MTRLLLFQKVERNVSWHSDIWHSDIFLTSFCHLPVIFLSYFCHPFVIFCHVCHLYIIFLSVCPFVFLSFRLSVFLPFSLSVFLLAIYQNLPLGSKSSIFDQIWSIYLIWRFHFYLKYKEKHAALDLLCKEFILHFHFSRLN